MSEFKAAPQVTFAMNSRHISAKAFCRSSRYTLCYPNRSRPRRHWIWATSKSTRLQASRRIRVRAHLYMTHRVLTRTNDKDATDLSASPQDHKHAQAGPVSLVINSFLDFLVLIWRNTQSRGDALRDAVMDLVKPHLHQLMCLNFFQTLMMDMVGFGDDIVHSLAEDSFNVEAFAVLAGLQNKCGIRFAGA